MTCQIIKIMEKKKILYIHGFRSSAKSSTITRLQRQWTDFEIHAIDVNHHPAESIAAIERYVLEHGIDLLMGTSLGGYYVLAANVALPKVVVNPVIEPGVSLDREDMYGTLDYFNERADGVQTVVVERSFLKEFDGIPLHLDSRTRIIGSTHDELLGDLTATYRELVGDRFTPTDMIGHRINEHLTAPGGLLHQNVLQSLEG